MDPKMIRNGNIVTNINRLISAGRLPTESEFSSFCGVIFQKLLSFPVLLCIKYDVVVLNAPSILPKLEIEIKIIFYAVLFSQLFVFDSQV